MSSLRFQVGALVRHHRDRLGLSQTDLGERVGRSWETISRIERGKTAPSLALIEALAAALVIEPRDLFGAGAFAAKTRKRDPLARMLDLLCSLSDEEIERSHKLLLIARSLTSGGKAS